MLATEFPLPRAALSRLASSHGTPVAPPPDASSSPPAATPALGRLAAVRARVPALREACGKQAWDAAVNRRPFTVLSRRPRGEHREPGVPQVLRGAALVRAAAADAVVAPVRGAPGGFVQAVGDAFSTDAAREAWSWVAMSLDAPGAPTPATSLLPMDRGVFRTGDVMDPACADALLADEAGNGFDLVTADGAVEMDHAHLERAHLPLLFAETRVALSCLKETGCVMLKFFEGALPETQLWMAWMTTRFQRVSIIKPTSSRSTNSERYLVGRGFLGVPEDDDDDLCLDECHEWHVAEAWTREVQAIVDRMADEQCKALTEVMALLER